jgi:hypothetical protein
MATKRKSFPCAVWTSAMSMWKKPIGYALNAFLAGLSPSISGSRLMRRAVTRASGATALIAAMQRRARQVRDGGLKRIEAIVERRLHGAIDIGEGVALIASPRPLAPGEPAVTDAPFLANARFILEKQTDFLVRMGLANLSQAFGEPPLKASCAASSFSGWRGRAFCREKPSRLMATDMDHG